MNPNPRRDWRGFGLVLTAIAVLALGLAIAGVDERPPAGDAMRQSFDDAVALLRAKHFREAEPRWRALAETCAAARGGAREPRLHAARAATRRRGARGFRGRHRPRALAGQRLLRPGPCARGPRRIRRRDRRDAHLPAPRAWRARGALRRARSALWEWESQREAARADSRAAFPEPGNASRSRGSDGR